MSYNTELQANNEELQSILNTVNALPNADSGGDIDLGVTGATVGQTVKIAEVDENGVPTAWLPTDFPSGGGGSVFKLLAKAEPITEPVNRVEVSIEEDGITEIYLVGKIKQEGTSSYTFANILLNGKIAAWNTGISDTQERHLLYHGVILEGGYCLCDFKINSAVNTNPNQSLAFPQDGFNGFGEQIKTVSLFHANHTGALATGTYFDVWGR